MSNPAFYHGERFQVLGVGIDRVDLTGAVDRIAHFLETGGIRQVVTINPEFTIAARHNRRFYQVLRKADLAVADGIGIVWAARLLGDRLPERVGGIDLVERLAERAARDGYRIFLLGAAPGVAESAAAALIGRNPRLRIVGAYAGSPLPGELSAIRAKIDAAHPDILLVAFGAPAQDLWIAENQAAMGVPVAIGVGGAFDFLAGRIRRAPRWIQRIGLEWLYRLARQPSRWRRMTALPRFAGMILVLIVARSRK
jgi:N-acetylglucosaminyldiphosphoundecaprenol N-acetyl-beta-D-mannosaminyltransferase